MSDDDITSHYHGGHPRSVEAHESIRGEAKRVARARVYNYVHAQGLDGAICDEAEIALSMSHQSCSARFSDLKRDDMIVETNQQRLTRSGRYATVCVAAVHLSPA